MKTVFISPNDLKTLNNILMAYAAIVRARKPSKDRTRLLSHIHSLRFRLNNSDRLFVTIVDLSIIDEGITIFITQVQKRIPQSKIRDETLQSCENLRQYFKESFARLLN